MTKNMFRNEGSFLPFQGTGFFLSFCLSCSKVAFELEQLSVFNDSFEFIGNRVFATLIACDTTEEISFFVYC